MIDPFLPITFRCIPELYVTTPMIGSNQDPRWTQHVENVEKWVEDFGEYTHRLDYDLDEDSVVLDVGGYVGDWSANMFIRYRSTVHVFEPSMKFFKILSARFRGCKKILLHNIALSDSTGDVELSDGGDGSSMMDGRSGETIRAVDILEWIKNNNVDKVDLMKLNIEGAEYDLLERIIHDGDVSIFENIQVQFHWWINDSETRMQRIRLALEKTHYPTYSYKYVWENWKKR